MSTTCVNTNDVCIYLQHAGTLQRWLYAANLHPCHTTEAGRGSSNDGQLHGTGHVRHPSSKKHRKEGTVSSPVLFEPFRTFRHVGHGVGQAVDPHFDPHLKVHFCNEKHPKSEDFRCFLELLSGFEPLTSSLPTAVEPSIPCCTRLSGGFFFKKDEVTTCLLHCFRPLVSPCGSRCGSKLLQRAEK